MSYRTSSNTGDPAGVNPWPSLDDEIAARIAGDAALQAQITAIVDAQPGVPVSTDGSFGLPAPTGVGLEWIIVGNEMDSAQMDGVEL